MSALEPDIDRTHRLRAARDFIVRTVKERVSDAPASAGVRLGRLLEPARLKRFGGAEEDRTPDLLLAKQALSRTELRPRTWWARADLNRRPHPYQGCALTN